VKLPLFGQKRTEKAEEEEPFRQLSVNEAKAMLESGQVQLIDVREPSEYTAGHIPGARNVPLNTLLRQPGQYLTTDNLMFVCASGQRSAVACEMAASLGFKQVFNIEAGTTGWMMKGCPVEK
jgi:rhodanese-related sulfurtransferase